MASMAEYSLNDLLAAYEGQLLPQWEESVSVIAKARSQVERFLDAGGHAYGFSTFFGHLDRYPIDPAQSRQILEAHLIGETQIVDAAVIRAISVVKICQLSQGLNGISVGAYRTLLEEFGKESDSPLDLDASYGSGDVVCGSWWVRAVFGDAPEYRQGDVISLINGHFVVPGLLLHHRDEFRGILSTALRLINTAQQMIPPGEGQLPVSTRDLSPLTSHVNSVLEELDRTLVSLSNQGTGNPLFTENLGEVWPQSNSSFLGFGVSTAVWRLGDVIRLLSAYVRAVTHTIAILREQEAAAPVDAAYWVQYPKVSKAYLDQIDELLTDSVTYGQAESGGVEDIGDGALIRMRRVASVIPLFRKQLDLLSALLTR